MQPLGPEPNRMFTPVSTLVTSGYMAGLDDHHNQEDLQQFSNLRH